MMNFNMAITHPSGDSNKLNGYVGLEFGGGIGAGDKHLGVISIRIAFVTVGPQGNLGGDHAHTWPRERSSTQPRVLQHLHIDQRKTKGSEEELGFL